MKVLVGVYGVYDLVAMWLTYQIQGGTENNIQKFLGASPMENRQLYFDASPISYATYRQQQDRRAAGHRHRGRSGRSQAAHRAVHLALKQAGFFVRPCIVHGAPHYWMNDPIDEPTSYSGFLAPRLMRFLAEKL